MARRSARDGRDDVDHRAFRHGRVEVGRFAVDEQLDVLAQQWTRVTQAVLQSWPPLVQTLDELSDGRAGKGHAVFGSGEQLEQGSRQDDRGHSVFASASGSSRQSGRTAASTDQTGGRFPAISDQLSPSSRLPYSWPVLVPK